MGTGLSQHIVSSGARFNAAGFHPATPNIALCFLRFAIPERDGRVKTKSEFLPMPSSRSLYGSAVFLSAFLLFLVEPVAARQLLPALGGSSAVWLPCLVFFQTMLLLGYLYAPRLNPRHFRPRLQPLPLALL